MKLRTILLGILLSCTEKNIYYLSKSDAHTSNMSYDGAIIQKEGSRMDAERIHPDVGQDFSKIYTQDINPSTDAFVAPDAAAYYPDAGLPDTHPLVDVAPDIQPDTSSTLLGEICHSYCSSEIGRTIVQTYDCSRNFLAQVIRSNNCVNTNTLMEYRCVEDERGNGGLASMPRLCDIGQLCIDPDGSPISGIDDNTTPARCE